MIRSKKILLCVGCLLVLMAAAIGAAYAAAPKSPVSTGTSGEIKFNAPSGIRWNEGMARFEVFSEKGIGYIGSYKYIGPNGEESASAITGYKQATRFENYAQMQDISFGASAHNSLVATFSGVYDGRGFNIKGAIGSIFGEVFGTIRNINLVDPDCPGPNKTFIVTNSSKGIVENCKLIVNNKTFKNSYSFITTNFGTVKNCSAEGSATGQYLGFMQYNESGTVVSFVNNMDIDVISGYVGGVASEFIRGSIIDCVNNGNISISTSASIEAGGIVGSATKVVDTTSRIAGCVNNGEVKYTVSTSAIIAGGILGSGSNINISNCVNNGGVYANSGVGGGIVGKVVKNVVVSGSSNSGFIDGYISGGIIGNSAEKLTVTDSRNSGTITGKTIGGITGNSTLGTTISGSTNNGYIGGDNRTNLGGGIVGEIYDAFIISNCTNNGKIDSGQTNNIDGVHLGGIVGSVATVAIGDIRYCVNNGEVFIYSHRDDYAGGGIGGDIRATSAKSVKIANCINTARIYGFRANMQQDVGIIISGSSTVITGFMALGSIG